MAKLLVLLAVAIAAAPLSLSDEITSYIAEYLDVRGEVLDNLSQEVRWQGRFYLTNTGDKAITAGNWAIYYSFIRLMEPDSMPYPDGVVLGSSGFTSFHINGCLNKLKPNENFETLEPGAEVVIEFTGSEWVIAKTDWMPNWYVVNESIPGEDPGTIVSTTGEDLTYVHPITLPQQYKRTVYDLYEPYTASVRFDHYPAQDLGYAPLSIIPQPLEIVFNQEYVDLSSGDWVVVANEELANEAAILAEYLDTTVEETHPFNRFLQIAVDPELWLPVGCEAHQEEGYHVSVQAHNQMVFITAKSAHGALHGVFTFISMLDDDTMRALDSQVWDCPRFQHRGLMIDVARNFFPLESMLKVIDSMALFKLNKLHLHLTDDEGWRLEIPGIEELTTLGANRCHDPSGDKCIIPQLGSNPLSGGGGSGYYRVEEYRKLLQYAQDRHIDIIPEFDFPGHSHAAIKAMELRFRTYEESDPSKATQYRLIDPTDNSDYLSVQYFKDNAIDPCLNTTYDFIRKIAEEIQILHADIQPLKVFHFGGDEVPGTAWSNSSACRDLKLYNPDVPQNATNKELKGYFAKRVSKITSDLGMDMAAWEDGLIGDADVPYDRDELANDNVYAMAWQNIWEWGVGSRAYRLANAGYKSIISHATHLYFDHPYEPDPQERGYYWAPRYTDTRKTFNFMPDSIYDNIEVDRFGHPLDKDNICQTFGCPPLESDNHVVGIQAHLWSETVRTWDQLYAMLFPRVIALAERAWHKAPWEEETDKISQDAGRLQDWEKFANTLGHHSLKKLANLGITYHLRPPAVRIINGNEVEALAVFPGLPIRISLDGGATYQDYKPGMTVPSGSTVTGITMSTDGSRHSLPSTPVTVD